jgi:hypothetical protein
MKKAAGNWTDGPRFSKAIFWIAVLSDIEVTTYRTGDIEVTTYRTGYREVTTYRTGDREVTTYRTGES